MLYATPVAAVLITMVLGALIFTLLGYDGLGQCARSSSRR
jgi:ABC-type uncharacterized transport system permease subunit